MTRQHVVLSLFGALIVGLAIVASRLNTASTLIDVSASAGRHRRAPGARRAAMTIVRTADHYQRRLMMLGICGLIVLAGPTLGADTFDGSYIGKRVTKNTNPLCISSEDVSVTINGEVLTFTDRVMHNFAVGFYPRQDGSFGMISTAIGGAAVLIRGRVAGGVLDADVTNGPCEHHWHLTKNPS